MIDQSNHMEVFGRARASSNHSPPSQEIDIFSLGPTGGCQLVSRPVTAVEHNWPCKGTGVIASAPWGSPVCFPDIILGDLFDTNEHNETKKKTKLFNRGYHNDNKQHFKWQLQLAVFFGLVYRNGKHCLTFTFSRKPKRVTQEQRLTLLTCWSLKLYHWPSLKDLIQA